MLHQPDDGAAGVWRFLIVTAMKPYEFTFCAGPTPTSLRAAVRPPGTRRERCRGRAPGGPLRPSLADSPGLARIGSIVRASIGYYEDLLGVRCPYDKLDIVFVPELGALASSGGIVIKLNSTSHSNAIT